jgi:hypothetical protein
MAQIRLEMHEDVRSAVQGAHSLTDWRRMVRSHPWLLLGVAAFAGYLIAPRRHPPIPTIVAAGDAAVESALALPRRERIDNTGGSALRAAGTVLSLLVPVLIRAAQNQASRALDKWLAANPLSPGEPRPGSRSTGENSRPVAPPRSATRLRDQR